MPDWTRSMVQTFEYYIVDPGTWKDKRRIRDVESCSIDWDVNSETLGSAQISLAESFGECYIRAYLITFQDGITEKFPLSTFIVQTPSSDFNGKNSNTSMDAYTPLLELKENPPPLGYSILKGENILNSAYLITRDNVRAPVVKPECDEVLYSDFVSDINDTWLSFNRDLISNAKFEYSIDEMGNILFSPKQDTASLQPVHTYDDDNSSILYPKISIEHDIYKIPNVVEVIYSSGNEHLYAIAVNDDESSPLSTVNRGRKITHRVTDPSLAGNPTKGQIKEYAEQVLREMSTVEYVISYSHGYCRTRVGDCVRLNYKKAGINNVKAKIISQSIKCVPGCPVTEKAVFTSKLWR